MILQRLYTQILFMMFLSVAQCNLALGDENALPNYVGRTACIECHAEQNARWQGSHHDLAMQEVTEKTVLGDFDNASFNYFGTLSRFFQRDGRFFVQTDGPDGKLHDYPVKYTFGVYPLQQYLLELSNGRLQALSIAWDARPKTEGGQRWFHLYPQENLTHDDELHWTGRNQNWNAICAECHSTELKKHYDPKTQRFATTFAEIDVSCEACHGPAADHIKWAKREPGWQTQKTKGLSLLLNERQNVYWLIDPKTAKPRRSQPRQSSKEIEMCARCHARRTLLSEEYEHGKPLMDTHMPRLLEENLYYADGQIQDEVYVYGSFLQSKMYQAGVTCSDCHEPHSVQLRLPNQQVCFQCHAATQYQTPKHHFHPSESTGANCIACHMPTMNYMVVDPRHDHSFRMPRPDLSQELGTPNVCNDCHNAQSPAWAADKLKAWYGKQPPGFHNFAKALSAARVGSADAETRLQRLANDDNAPAIARATALSELATHLSANTFPVLEKGLQAAEPLIRFGALQALEALPLDYRIPLFSPLLTDPVRSVRIEAARLLAPAPSKSLNPAQRQAFKKAAQEYVAAQRANAERPEAQVNLGIFYTSQRKTKKAKAAYQQAIKLAPDFMPAYVNLADFYRLIRNDAKGKQVLRHALQQNPQAADVHHALGLLLIREKKLSKAIEHLSRAASTRPENVRYSYVYAIALNAVGRSDKAITVLEQLHTAHPDNREILDALITYHRELGNFNAMVLYIKKRRQLEIKASKPE